MLSKKEIVITVLYLVYVIFYVLNDMHVLKIGNLPNLLVPTILFLCLKYEIRRNSEHKKKYQQRPARHYHSKRDIP